MKWLLILVILFAAVDAESSAKHRKHSSKYSTPTTTPPAPTPDESPAATETPSASPAESSEAGRGKKGWPNASLSPDAIEGYANDPPKVRQILDAGLALTKQNL